MSRRCEMRGRTGPGRRIGVAALIVLGIVSILIVARVPPAAAEDGPTSIQFNMWGLKSATGYNQNVAPFTLAKILSANAFGTSPYVWTVSLNEVCWIQWLDIWNNFMGTNSFQAEAWWSVQPSKTANFRRSSDNASCGAFGNTISVRGTARTSNAPNPRAFAVQGASASGYYGEVKGFACLQSNYFGQLGCTAHTQADDPPTANTQLNDMDSSVNSFAVAGSPMLLHGDFNVEPSQSAQLLYWHYPLFVEADGDPSQKRATVGTRRLDYIFRRAPNSRSSLAAIWETTWRGVKYSDHAFYNHAPLAGAAKLILPKQERGSVDRLSSERTGSVVRSAGWAVQAMRARSLLPGQVSGYDLDTCPVRWGPQPRRIASRS